MGIVAEEWRAVAENPYYEVSNTGKVKSLARTVMRKDGKPYRTKDRIMAIASLPKGYRFVSLYDEQGDRQHYVHRLVARAFIGPCPDGHEVNHIDGDKSNNCVENLEYVTRAGNMAHAKAMGKAGLCGEQNYACRHSEEKIRRGYEMVKSGMQYKQVAEAVGVSQGALESACRGVNWKSLGLEPIVRQVRRELP